MHCLVVLLALATVIAVAAGSSDSESVSQSTTLFFTEELIKCKVCERAVTHVWERAETLRTKCLTTPRGMVERDRRCDFHDVHPWAVDQMVWGVCDALPASYRAIHESEFDLVLDEDPQHGDELVELLKKTCDKFVHKHHGIDALGTMVLDHLRHGHSGERARAMIRTELCSHVCAPPPAPKRPRRYFEPVRGADDDEL